ncbi:MAG: hypothetical protein IKY67_07130 [Paludibacteraceae bacterium]|nr:hypothetical protein [Paludibacteraceae bacterium]
MKNLFFIIANNSFFSYAKRLVAICMLLSISIVVAANNGNWSGTAYGKAAITSTSTGAGIVYVNQNSTPSGSETNSASISNTNTSATFYWHAVAMANSNSAFDGWYKEIDASGNKYKGDATFSESISGSSDNKNPEQTYYAHFKKMIDPKQSVIDWTKTDEEEIYSTTVDLYKATNFDIQSVVHSGEAERTFSCKITKSTEDNVTLELTAGANVVNGDQFVITLVADNGGYATITVNIKSNITVTFLHPSVGKGSYVAVQTNAGGGESCNLGNADGDQNVTFTKTNQFYHTFNATPHTDYNFYRWVITHEDNSVSYFAENPMTYTVQDGDKITAEFLPKNMAQFIVKGIDDKFYFKLEDAIVAAQASSSKTVVVYTSGVLYNEHLIPTEDGKYEFTIPAGITLLVPGDVNNTVRTSLTEEDLIATSTTPSLYRKLTLLPNTKIITYGNICVYSALSCSQLYNGRPTSYGQIEMQDGSQIVLNNGSCLTAFGYITGNPEKSQVLAKNGSTVYEAFQVLDWRGGTATSEMNNNAERVFPFGQYYVQSIETKLTLQKGAVEYVSFGIDVTLIGEIAFNLKYVGETTTIDNEDEGLFCLGEGAELSKWYNGEYDRQVYEVRGTKENAIAKFGVVNLNIQAVFVKVDAASKNYVMPITNNFDISLHNIELYSLYDFALLADATAYIAEDATFVSKGNLFIYDKEYNVGYFYADDSKLKPIQYTAYHEKNPGLRTVEKVDDAQLIIDGKLIVEQSNSAKDGSGFYTTAKGENGLSLEDGDYGAYITSNGGGCVDFRVKGNKSVTYQYLQQSSSYLSIPITNARLSNGDGSWSAGKDVEIGDAYIYSQSKQRWVLPQELSFGNYTGNEFNITMPTVDKTTKDLVVTMITNKELSKEDFRIDWSENDYFTIGDFTYSVEDKQLIIPITYTLTKVHNLGNPNKLKISISCEDKDENLGNDLGDELEVTLSATENYTPDFSVIMGGKDVTTDKQYTFSETVALNSLSASVVITPTSNTVATLSNTNWQCEATTSPTFATEGEALNSLHVVYTPQSGNTTDNGLLTITATYTDAASNNTISKKIVINLNGTGRLQDNTLAFKQDLINGYTIYQGAKYSDIFANSGNATNVTFTCTYVGGDVDGQDASELVTISNNIITANEVASITEERKVKVVAAQNANTTMNSVRREITLTVVPTAIWNWSDLYFGAEYTNPVTPQKEGEWTLTIRTNPNNLVGTLQGDYTNYSVTIATGNVNDVYEAQFTFTQGTYTKVFTSKIYADPRVLDLCVDAAHKYKGVTKSATGGVSFDDEKKMVSFNSGAMWVFEMSGVPETMTFTISGENQWNIEQRATESSAWSPVVTWSNLSNGEQSFTLLPTTSYVRITYGSANVESIGQLSNICISKLSIKADVDELYLPINKDGSTSSRTIVLTHTEATAPTLSSIDGLVYNTETSDNLGSLEEPYYQTNVTITTPSSFAKGAYVLTAAQGSVFANISIYADYFPQGLPIKLATDDVKRYHFIATASDNVSWDATNKQVVMQNPGGSVARSVVLAFEGAPSRIKFTASRDIVDPEWKIYESVDGTDGSFVESSLVNRDTEVGTAFTHNLQYTTRYVRIYYYSENQSELRLSDLVIEGDPMLIVNPKELEFSEDKISQTLTLTAINLKNIRIELDNTTDFQMSHGSEVSNATYTLTSTDYPDALGVNKVGDIVINTKWITNSIVNDGVITIYNVDDNNAILAKVKLVGAGKYLRKVDANKTGIYTGIPDGTRDTDGDGNPNTDYKYTFHGSDYEGYQYHEVDLSKVFAEDGTALFDYLFIYGETTPIDGTNITAPSGDNGSNARTPYYVYIRDVDAYGKFDRYRFVKMVDNANIGDKNSLHIPEITTNVSSGTAEDNGNTLYIDVPKENGSVRVYISGFCPYASTGTSKYDEGVFFFRGKAGSKLDVYLEDAHIVARNKMADGQPFYARGDKRNPTFTEGYARGSGGVLVFENVEITENLMEMVPFEVTIHTLGDNLLKSNYGCFNYFFGMDPFQISAPIHVRLHSTDHVNTSKTTLNFTDEWPTALNADRTVSASTRTNGFISLQKLNNNAPSIDLGNPLTEVNFRGGQVELQNAQIVSTNYKTTLAISYRAGEYGSDNLGLRFAYGIGTDDVGGSVNFYDGTVTIQPMWVAAEYKDYYLIDKDTDGNDIKRETGKTDQYGLPIYEYLTTCLRCPKNTKVYGGSICWLRACQHVTSKGGAPSDGNSLLGQYIYEFGGEDTKDEITGLVTKINFPGDVASSTGDPLANYYNIYHPSKTYGIESVTPDAGNKLYFWIPEGYGEVTAERDNILTTWKACMTEISAGLYGKSGSIGGDIPIEQNEEVKYLLYCKIDKNIHGVISAGDGDGENKTYSYKAPVKVPDVALNYYGQSYAEISPTFVGGDVEHEVLSDASYTVTDKVYYVATATADVWQTFTAPFDVKNIWVLETYKESALEATELKSDGQNNQLTKRKSVMLEQARHNADFAAFFAVAMAIGTTDSFDEIYNSYIEWAKLQDTESGLYTSGDYLLRGKYQLTPYINLTAGGTNWNSANFYLNHNHGNWQIQESASDNEPNSFTPQWSMLSERDLGDGILLHKGETYSMLFPYCVGCLGEDEEEREEWDYWSGKFIIFESTDGQEKGIHTIKGRNFLDETIDDNIFAVNPEEGQVVVTGNSTFAFLEPTRENIYSYYPTWGFEGFYPYSYKEDVISPTTAFLYGNVPTPEGASVMSISRMGKINYRTGDSNGDDTPTGGEHVPTVGGGSDIFVTSVADGINIAVSEPQYVGVFSANGALLYNGWVETAVNVNLVSNGVYVVVGENNSVKVVY